MNLRLRSRGHLCQAIKVWLVFAACTEAPPANQSADPAPKPEEIRVEGLTLDRFEGGLLKARTHAARATVDRGQGSVSAERVRATIFESTSAPPLAEIRAQQSDGQIDGHRLNARGNVTITDREGRVLETELAVWELDRDRLIAPGPVRLRGENFVAQGSSLAADLKSRQIEVAGPLKGRIGR